MSIFSLLIFVSIFDCLIGFSMLLTLKDAARNVSDAIGLIVLNLPLLFTNNMKLSGRTQHKNTGITTI